ncbi:hypothetical protein V8J82_16710 [Gymnodinialimonas sp. 2305UL16-5]|uniref:hypothetical protein n=1 Tax=Gymnodinialimonas mytili TaxID=3126503 RepID=UPI0030B6B99A
MPVAAAAETYICVLQSRVGAVIPPDFQIAYSGDTATISHGWHDGLRQHQSRVRGDSARSRVAFSITNFRGFGGARATLQFQLVHARASNTLNVTVRPSGYSNRFTGSGTCQRRG